MATNYNRTSLMIPPDQLEELQNCFQTIDSDGNGVINVAELGKALDTCGFKLPGYKVRDLIQDFDNKIKDDQLDFEEFKGLYARLKMETDFGHAFKKAVSPPGENVRYVAGSDSSSAEGTTHSVRNEEQVAFSNWINRNLSDDPDCKKYLPLNPDSKELYTKTNDGILYCKMVNSSSPGTIDERTINKGKLSVFQIHENLTLALNSAQSIGCNIINIGPEDLRQGKPHLVLGLLWQIIRIGLFSEINLHENPNLAILLMEGETLEEFMKLSPEHILIRWVNYHLARSGCGRQIANFQGDIKDSIAYIHLLDQISPKEKGVTTRPENEPDMRERAELMLQEAEKIECRSFVSPDDVVSGNYKLNVAFVANLFNNYPALEETEVDFPEDITEETRKKKKVPTATLR